MTILNELGFKENWIYEAIVSTEEDGNINHAPMGVWTQDLKTLTLKTYKTSRTADIINDTREFTVNLTDDLDLFYKALYEKDQIKAGKSDTGKPCIKGVDAYIVAKVVEVQDLGEAYEFTGEVVESKVIKKPRLVNRADALMLETLIEYTKLPYVKGKEAAKTWIREYCRTIKKVAPGSKYDDVVDEMVGELG